MKLPLSKECNFNGGCVRNGKLHRALTCEEVFFLWFQTIYMMDDLLHNPCTAYIDIVITDVAVFMTIQLAYVSLTFPIYICI